MFTTPWKSTDTLNIVILTVPIIVTGSFVMPVIEMEFDDSIIVSCLKAWSLTRFTSDLESSRKLVLGLRNSGATNSTTGESS